MPKGLIIKALSGFYYVRTEEGVVACRARGKFRLDGVSPLVGDVVSFDMTADGKGFVQSIAPRKNLFIRPAVANVDYLVLMCANVNPITDPFLVDRVAVIAEHAGCGCIICINKCDLDPGDELYEIFSSTAYPLIRTSAVTGEGVSELWELIRGKTVAFAGNSGVGKSSLLNVIAPGYNVSVGEVSEVLGRGKHTTRHVELIEAAGGFVFDTPGFSRLETDELYASNLWQYFPEISSFHGECRFRTCNHVGEPGCSVKQALEDGIIAPSRYENYVTLFNKLKEIKDWERKD